ncbi:MAG: metallophosphoesterase family protein [Bacillota bacterium]
MVSFIHSGDIHLGLKFRNASFGGGKGKTRREEIWHTFSDMIQYSIKTDKDLVLISGDLFEENTITMKDITRLKNIFANAKKQQIVISPGNHDSATNDSPYASRDWPDNVTVFNGDHLDEIHFEMLKTSVWGMGPRRKAGEVLRGMGDIGTREGYRNILMLHGETGGRGDYPLPDIKDLKSLHMDYIALGHIHKPEFLEKNIAYCGSLEPLDFGEIGTRGFVEGELPDAESYKFVPYAKRNFHRIQLLLDEQMTIEAITNHLVKLAGENRYKNFYRVVLKGVSHPYLDMGALESQLKREFYHLELINSSRNGIDIQRLSRDNRDNILGMFIDSFCEDDLDNPVKREAFYSGIYALLEGSGQV